MFQLYHNYADQAGYYDVCLLIYHVADHRNIPDVRNTWSNLIEQVHNKAVGEGQISPWESVAMKVEDIGHRTNLNENVFPINIVLQLLLQYDLEFYTHDANPPRQINAPARNLPHNANLMWPIDVFIKLNAPFEGLTATLEALWYAQEPPFTGKVNRKMLIKWMIYLIEQWSVSSRRTGALFGGAENAIGLADLLRVVLGSDVLERSPEDQIWAQRARDVSSTVEEAAR
jgi:nuclear pore complex protein Nup155